MNGPIKIHPQFMRHALREAALLSVERDLRQEGYIVQKETNVGDVRLDLLATKGDIVVACEIRVAGETERGKISEIKRRVQSVFPQARFEMLFIPYPIDREVEVEDIESKIWYYLTNVDPPSEIDNLSTHSRIEEVADIDITKIILGKDRFVVGGSGSILVNLQYGSDGDVERGDGVESTMSFPFTFEALLNEQRNIETMEELEIDVSRFYEGDDDSPEES